MARISKYMVAYNFQLIARSIIIVLALIIFSIGFIGGVEDFQGGIDGIIMNSPYSVAWLVLLVILLVSWVWELAGGITIFIMSIYSFYFFIVKDATFTLSSFSLVLSLFILSISLLAYWYLSRNEDTD